MDEDVKERITVDPDIMVGKPVITGTRVPVYVILEMFEAGNSIEDVLDAYPALEEEDVKAALRYATSVIEHSEAGGEAAVV
ncbi:MAG: DUF433 domain-containing protein [Candidatus Nanohaloarchaea archaeon]|nr:DUF433 domain-containing protein [Candidatus Nanohaloarchaea archaeon]